MSTSCLRVEPAQLESAAFHEPTGAHANKAQSGDEAKCDENSPTSGDVDHVGARAETEGAEPQAGPRLADPKAAHLVPATAQQVQQCQPRAQPSPILPAQPHPQPQARPQEQPQQAHQPQQSQQPQQPQKPQQPQQPQQPQHPQHPQPHQQQPQQAKARRRKLSVFAHDGFPDISLLDQQNLKVRSAQEEQLARRTSLQPPPPVAEASGAPASDAPMTAQSSSSAPTGAPQLPGACELPAAKLQAHRNVRTDTLGSTGSSRASSCDEPPAAPFGPVSPTQPSKREPGKTSAIGASSIASIAAEQEPQGALEPPESGDCSSNSSSLDDSLAGWSYLKSAQGDQQPPAKQLSAPEKRQLHQKPPLFPPFESIKTQLKRNSMPNAQLILSHIDNLISRNEAIVDNWNLVSIRSYNSTRDSSPQSKALGQPEEARHNRRWLFGLAGARAQSERRTSQGAIGQRPSQSELVAPRKRCSTSAIPSAPANLVVSARSMLAPILSAAAAPNSRDSLLSGSNYTPSLDPPSQPTESSMNRLSFSSQASGYSLGESISSSPRLETGDQVRGELDSAYLSHQVQTNVDVLKLLSDHQRHLRLSGNQQEVAAMPMQLESAIQNLSLKRKDDELNSYQPTSPSYRLAPSGPLCDERHLAASSLDHHSQHPHSQHNHSAHHHHHHHHHGASNSLWNNSAEQQQNLIPTRRDEQLVLAALLMERHRQSLADLESQAALLRQQQMIEQQHQLNQLVVDQQQQQQQHQQQQHQQHQFQAEVAAAVAAAASLPQHLMHNNGAEPHRAPYLAFVAPSALAPQAAAYDQVSAALERYRSAAGEQASVCDSHLLNNFLTKVMTNSGMVLADSHLHGSQNLQPTSELRQHSHLVSASGGAKHCLTSEGQAEMLSHSLESATPLHRCDTCDIAFWTRDLLNYHLITQCAARSQQQRADTGGDPSSRAGAGSPTFRRPLSFNFTGPNNFDHYLNNEQLQTTNESRAGSHRMAFEAANLLAPSIQTNEHSKSASPPSRTRLLGSSRWLAGANSSSQEQHAAPEVLEAPSILKQQLLTECPQAEVHDQFLPFKKRKISEPNMKLNSR